MRVWFDHQHNQYVLKDDERRYLTELRKLPARIWDGKEGVWRLPFVKECYDALLQGTWELEGLGRIPEAKTPGYTIEELQGGKFILVRTLATTEDVARCRKIPEFRSFSSQHNGWTCRPTPRNIEYLRKAFPQSLWLGPAAQLKEQAQAALATRQMSGIDLSSGPDVMAYTTYDRGQLIELINDYKFHDTPYKHQLEVFAISRNKPVFALLMEMGTGKSYVIIHNMAYLYQQGKIDAGLIVCPNSMKDPWEELIQEHMPPGIDTDVFVWEAKTRHKIDAWIHQRHQGAQPLRLLIMNVDAFSGPKGTEAAHLFVAKHNTMMVVDESTKIKSPSAKRTRNVTKVGRDALYRRIMSGLPSPQNPLDIYSQARFLDPTLLGHSTWFGFRNTYAIMGGFNGKQIVGFVNLDQLQEKIKPWSYRKLKKECLDLPEKIYEKVVVELSPDQKKAYDDMRDDMQAEVQGKVFTVQLALQKLQALARITGGFFPHEVLDDDQMPMRLLEPIPGGNPKLDALDDLIEENPDEKFIIWAHFTAEIELILEHLKKKHGPASAVDFYGKTSKLQRTQNRKAFQEGDAQFFVGQAQAGGMGLTLTSSHQVVYYSNDFNLESRVQSEDRAHRIGQTKNVVYTDLVAKGTIDLRLLRALRKKKGLSDLVMGDPTLSWI